MIVRVEVTQEDINHGEPGGTRGCPIWHALHRVLAAAHIAVLPPGAEIGEREVPLPYEANEFIAAFDQDGPRAVGPFTFYLDVPDDLLREVPDDN